MRKNPRVLASAIVLVLTVALLAGCGADPTDQSSGPASAVNPVQERVGGPRLAGLTMAGEQLDPSAFAGKVTVVNFWASWCRECRREMPELIAASRTYAAEGVPFVGVNIRDSRSAATGFAEELGIPFPSLFDPDNTTLNGLREVLPPSPPSTVVLDRQGRIAATFIGEITQQDLAAPLSEILAEQA